MSLNFDDTKVAFQAKSKSGLMLSFLIFLSMYRPWVVSLGTSIISLALKWHLPIKWVIRGTLFEQFCGGESIADCKTKIKQLNQFNVKTILDYSVEGQESEKSFDHTLKEAMNAAHAAQSEEAIPFCVLKMTGLGSKSVMTKIQAGVRLTPLERQGFDRFKERGHQIAAEIASLNQRLLIDAEESWYQDVVDDFCYELMLTHNQKQPVVYNTYQFYRHQMLNNMKAGFAKMHESGCYFGAKIVRGAYMEQERNRAQERGYVDPIQPNKEATDRDYNEALRFAIKNLDHFSVCVGTHNEESSRLLVNLMHENKVKNNDQRLFFAQLLGMSDNISFKLSQEGYNVAKYVPYGPVEKVIPYLLRRAEENTSVKGQTSRELMLIRKEINRRKLNK